MTSTTCLVTDWTASIIDKPAYKLLKNTAEAGKSLLSEICAESLLLDPSPLSN